ncbi:glycosyltransferase [Terasakiella pusilla]|uniref:glycosyltransferase n=1 Tax=Terasakiella pusilla TaxID=64973 RepID=UPI003AA910D6
MTKRKHITVIYTMAGGGHLKAAESLKEVLEETGRYRVTMVNPYIELMPHLDLWQRLTKMTSEDIYNKKVIGEGKTGLYCLTYYAGILLNFKLAYRQGRKLLGDYFKDQQPDLVISVLPMLNRVIFDAVKDYQQAVKDEKSVEKAVLITDWTEYGRHIWFPKGDDYYAICGTEDAFKRASSYKNLKGRVVSTEGLLLVPSFQEAGKQDKRAVKEGLGLTPDLPVVCMLYGGQGSWRMKALAQAMVQQAPDVQVLFLCGRNEALARDLQEMDMPFPHKVVGFTSEVPRYLAATDIFVGKPGPGSVSEALHFGQHLLLDKTMALPQEVPVLKWVVRSGAGAAFKNERDFMAGLLGLLDKIGDGGQSPQARPNIASRQIPAIIDKIVEGGTA